MAYITVPPQWTSVQDAVNLMIGSLGEAPVTTISPPPTNDVALALNALNWEDLTLQSKGWHWNREDAFELDLQANGTIEVPAMCLGITNAYYNPQFIQDGPIDIVQRGLLLYDRINHTNTFTAPVIVDMIVRLDWDSLPQQARAVEALRALKRFHAGVQQSQVVLQLNAADLAAAETLLEQREDEDATYNQIYGNIGAVSALFGAAGMRRNRSL